MGIAQIAFILINIAVPYWLWSSSNSSAKVKIKWPAWEKTMERLLDASGGFGCPTSEVLGDVRALCDRSLDGFGEKKTAIFEQLISDTLFSCEVRKDSIVVKIGVSPNAAPRVACKAKDTYATLRLAPEFVFTLSGFVNNVSFNSDVAGRQNVSVLACRRKLKLLKNENATTFEEFVSSLPRTPDDPKDVRAGNRLCVVYDAAEGWKPWREKFNIGKN